MRRPPICILIRVVVTVAVVWAIYLLRANVWFRLYPAAMVAIAWAAFAVSLGRTPLVEIIARRRGEALDARGVAYCRRVTRVWAVFLFVHLLITLATVFASYETWVLYNGCISYVLMGILFLGEWLYRRRMRRG